MGDSIHTEIGSGINMGIDVLVGGEGDKGGDMICKSSHAKQTILH